MAEDRVKVQLQGGLVDAVSVPIEEVTERWTDIRLAEGTTLRLKSVILSVARAIDKYDQDGNPLYAIKSSSIMTATNVPEHLRRGGDGSQENQ
jgi:hypothetical protein